MTNEYAHGERRVCIGIDAHRYSSANDHRQVDFQEAINRIASTAASAVGLERSSWRIQHSGDGEFCVLPPTVREQLVADQFVRELVAGLRRFNADRVEAATLRLRVAIHYGRLIETPTGFAGPAPVETARLLNGEPVRAELRSNPQAHLALIISDVVFQDNVASYHTTWNPRDFRKVRVTEKEYEGTGWVWSSGGTRDEGPEAVRAPAGPRSAEQPGQNFTFIGDTYTGNGTTFGNRY